MYEHSKGRLLPRKAFLWRLAKHAGLALAVVVFSLGAGMAGYVYMVFLVVVAIVLSPIVHQALHRFHLEGGK